MFYLAERRRSYVMQMLIFSALGALVVVFASFAFRAAAVQLCVHGRRSAFLVFASARQRRFFRDVLNGPIAVAAAGVAAAVGGCATEPLLREHGSAGDGGDSVPLVTTQTVSAPWLWALPFLLTFVGGVFADALETRQRRLFLVLDGRCAGDTGAGLSRWRCHCLRAPNALGALLIST